LHAAYRVLLQSAIDDEDAFIRSDSANAMVQATRIAATNSTVVV
jgi:hypothetical protein